MEIIIILVAVAFCVAASRSNWYERYEYGDNYTISTNLPLVNISSGDILFTVENETKAIEITSVTEESRMLFYCENTGKYLEFDNNKPIGDKFRYVELDNPPF